jgi:outer membrane immunogenic protein
MKKLLLSTVAGAALFAVAPANAADMALKAAPMIAPAYFSWTGCSVGGHAGWGWGKKSGIENTISPSPKWTTFGFDTSGAVFGGQLGCDYQFAGNWVLGVQGMLSATDINGFGPDADPSESSTISVKVDRLWSVTGRLGYAGLMPETLVYFKGGVAGVRDQWNMSNAVFDFPQLITSNRTGYTVGGGVEWAFARNWTAFAEYSYYDFGTKNVFSWTEGGDDVNSLIPKQTLSTVKVGLNYRLNWWR